MFSPPSTYTWVNFTLYQLHSCYFVGEPVTFAGQRKKQAEESCMLQLHNFSVLNLLLRAQGKVLTVRRTPLADPFLMNLASQPRFLVQDKPKEDEREEKGTITRTKLQVKIRDKPLLGHSDFQSNGRKTRKSSVSEGWPPPLSTS